MIDRTRIFLTNYYFNSVAQIIVNVRYEHFCEELNENSQWENNIITLVTDRSWIV